MMIEIAKIIKEHDAIISLSLVGLLVFLLSAVMILEHLEEKKGNKIRAAEWKARESREDHQ